MRIGELAAKMGVTPSAIRYYEQQGLMDTPERLSGKRIYDDGVLLQLKLIRLAQSAGFTISEIRMLSQGYKQGKPLSKAWLDIAVKKQEEVDQKLKELEQMKAVLNELLKCQCATVETCVSHALADDLA